MKKLIYSNVDFSEVLEGKDEYDKSDRALIIAELEQFAKGRLKGHRIFDKYGLYFLKYSIEGMIREYVRYYNQNVRECGDGYATDWDPDDRLLILYKNGKIREVCTEWDEGNKLISIDGIDSMLLDASWGTAFAGPSITFRDETVYDDILDIRADFI